MTIPVNDRIVGPVVCTGGETAIGYDFKITAAADLTVMRRRSSVETTLTLTTDYTVSGVGAAAGGTVTLVTAATAGDEYTVFGGKPASRTSDLVYNRALPPATMNTELDSLQAQIAELRRDVESALRASRFGGAFLGGGLKISNIAAGVASTDVATIQQLAAVAGVLAAADYPSRAAVAAAEITALQLYIRTAGYYAPGDGGHALYAKVGSEPSHAGKVQSADGAWWVLVPDGRGINVRTVGAKGDGSTDDTAAINAAFGVAMAFKKDLYLPAGTYRMTDDFVPDITTNGIQSGIGIYGEGQYGQSVLQFYGAGVTSGLIWSGDSGTYQYTGGLCDFKVLFTGGAVGGVSLQWLHHPVVEGIWVHGGGGGGVAGIEVENCNKPLVCNNLLTECGDADVAQIRLNRITVGLISANYIAESSYSIGGISIDRSNGTEISGNGVESCGFGLLISEEAEVSTNTYCEDIFVLRNSFENCGESYLRCGHGYSEGFGAYNIGLVGNQGFLSGSVETKFFADIVRTYQFTSDGNRFSIDDSLAGAASYKMDAISDHVEIRPQGHQYAIAAPWVLRNGVQRMDASPRLLWRSWSPADTSLTGYSTPTGTILQNIIHATQGGLYGIMVVANASATSITHTAGVPGADGARMTIRSLDGNTTLVHAAGVAGQFNFPSGANKALSAGKSYTFEWNNGGATWDYTGGG